MGWYRGEISEKSEGSRSKESEENANLILPEIGSKESSEGVRMVVGRCAEERRPMWARIRRRGGRGKKAKVVVSDVALRGLSKMFGVYW